MRSQDLVFLHNLHRRICEWLFCYADTTVLLNPWYWCRNPHLLWKFHQTFLGEASNLAPILSWSPSPFPFFYQQVFCIFCNCLKWYFSSKPFPVTCKLFSFYNWHIQELLFECTVTYFVTTVFNLSCSDCRWVMDLTYPVLDGLYTFAIALRHACTTIVAVEKQ